MRLRANEMRAWTPGQPPAGGAKSPPGVGPDAVALVLVAAVFALAPAARAFVAPPTPTFAGTLGGASGGGGQFTGPQGIAVDFAGNVFIVDHASTEPSGRGPARSTVGPGHAPV